MEGSRSGKLRRGTEMTWGKKRKFFFLLSFSPATNAVAMATCPGINNVVRVEKKKKPVCIAHTYYTYCIAVLYVTKIGTEKNVLFFFNLMGITVFHILYTVTSFRGRITHVGHM